MATKVPFVDLTRIHAPLKEDILKRIGSIIDRSAFVLGPEVDSFERDFAAFVGSAHAVGVSSGLDALILALKALEIGPGDEVIVPANTFIATAFAVSSCGAKPILVDCEEESYNIDPAKIEKAITSRTKAILPVHLYGQPADMGPIMDIAKKRGLVVVEDCAQSHGAKYDGKMTGTFGAISCFSFYPGKNLGAMGEGGAIVTADEKLRARVRMFRDVGQREKYHHDVIGHNSRLHTVQAAILSAKLPHLMTQTEDRVRAARRYDELMSGIPYLKLPKNVAGRSHVYHLYVVQTRSPDEREALRKHLNDRSVQCGIHYPIPIHMQVAYKGLKQSEGAFPVTEKLARTILSLPMFCGMTEDELTTVAKVVKEFYKC
jgi:dTDP-4-amino-4,6-dideoxygalactose transaminase